MGHQIIAERDRKRWALFCSNTDTFVGRNLTKREIIEYFVELSRERIESEVERAMTTLKQGGKPYHQFTLTLEEAEEQHRLHAGE